MRQDLAFVALNRGLVSKLGLARADVKRITLSAAIYNNWMPRVLGSMSIRPGLEYKGTSKNNLLARYLPFIFAIDDKAQIELTHACMRVRINDTLIERAAVATAITNGEFTTDIASWTDDDEAGATSSWNASGLMQLVGTGTNAARRTQAVTVAADDVGVEHAIQITIARGPVTLRVGTAAGLDDYITETDLDEGCHSLAITPTGTFYIRFQSRLERSVFVDHVAIEAAGPMEVVTPWPDYALSTIRKAPSGDILFIACAGFPQYKIERRGLHSWSVVKYLTDNGPFRIQNVTAATMVANALTGNGNLTCSVPYFRSSHVGALFSVTNDGQRVLLVVAGDNQSTDYIEVTGVGDSRSFGVFISGIDASPPATVTLQRAFATPVTWADVTAYTADTNVPVNDGFDNQIVYYRLTVKTGDNAGGATITLDIASGSGSTRGVCRITGISSATVAEMEVLVPFGGTLTPSTTWAEGRWSARRGYPTSVAIAEGRLGWFGKDSAALSVSDDYYNYDPDIEGDSGPIVRSIGSGPVDKIHWAMPLARLILGGQGAEHSCRSNSFDEVLTPSNFNIKKASRQGSADVEGVEIDDSGVFVQRGGTRVFEVVFNGDKLDYSANPLSALIPEIGKPSIVRIGVQRQPDTRLHFVRSDGTVAICVFDKIEGVTCWVTMDTPGASGFVEDVMVLPGNEGENEDHVYYSVRRTFGLSTVRYLEKWAFQDDCIGSTVTKLADSFIVLGPGHLTGLDHLEGQQVVVWLDGRDVSRDADGNLQYTVASGALPLTATSGAVVGLPYTAKWQSGKLTELRNQTGLAFKDDKNIPEIGFILADTHRFGLQFGDDFDHLDDLPSIENGAPVNDDLIHADYDNEPIPFPGTWTTDQRICLQAQAPRPVTVVALTAQVEHHG